MLLKINHFFVFLGFIQTAVDVYGPIVPGSNGNAVNKLDDEKVTGLKIVSSAG